MLHAQNKGGFSHQEPILRKPENLSHFANNREVTTREPRESTRPKARSHDRISGLFVISIGMVPVAGLEPASLLQRGILNPCVVNDFIDL